MAPKHTKSMAKVASKKPHPVMYLQVELKVTKNYKGGKVRDGYCSAVRRVPLHHRHTLDEQEQSRESC